MLKSRKSSAADKPNNLIELLAYWDRRINQGKNEISNNKPSIDENLLKYGVECYSNCADQLRSQLTPKKTVLLAIQVVGRHLCQEIVQLRNSFLFPKCFRL